MDTKVQTPPLSPRPLPEFEEPVQSDYFGVDVTEKVTLPDQKSWVKIRKLDEGQRISYVNKSNREVRLNRRTQDAYMQMAAGEDRKNLLRVAIVDWNLIRGGQPVSFGEAELEVFLTKADPEILNVIEKGVRKLNPWLLADLSVADIDKEIADLYELRAIRVKEEQGNS